MCDGERGYEILAEVRDILLPLVNPTNNICGDMGTCTVSNPECVICLTKRIKEQFEEQQKEIEGLKIVLEAERGFVQNVLFTDTGSEPQPKRKFKL